MSVGVIVASVVAGPIFVTTSMLAMLYLQLPEPIPVRAEDLLAVPPLLLAATLFGSLIALVPVIAGTAAMRGMADLSVPARSPVAWTMVGALARAGLSVLLDVMSDGPHFSFGLIVTSALCARISRGFLNWNDDPEPRT